MPSWVVVAARPTQNAVSENATRYAAPSGFLQQNLTEPETQLRVRGSYVLSNLYVRVSTNELAGNSTYRSRRNGVNGNLAVTVPGGATGVFEDNIHSDNLVDGNLFNTRIVAGAGSLPAVEYIRATIISYVLTAASDIPILAACHTFSAYSPGTRYFPIVGICQPNATEATVQYLFRIPAILSNLRVVVGSNTLAGATTIRTRRNGVNGNQLVNIPAGATGQFEDVINSDNVSNGDLVDYEQIAGGVGGDIAVYVLQVKSTGVGRQLGLGRGDAVAHPAGITTYLPLEGDPSNDGPEAWCQARPRTDLVVGNLCVRVTGNGNPGSVVRLRKNGANGNLSVAIPGLATGIFEDTLHSDSLATTDLVNYQLVTGAVITITLIGLQLPGVILPTVSTQAATNLTEISATLNGLLDDDGGEACACGFEWGETVALGNVTPSTIHTTGQTLSHNLAGLVPGRKYYFRAFATNSMGTSYGAILSFSTFVGPSVLTLPATLITEHSARFNGMVAEDAGRVGSARFQWGGSREYGQDTPWQQGKVKGDLFFIDLTGLVEATMYHFRAQFSHSPEVVSGADMAFQTLEPEHGLVLLDEQIAHSLLGE